MRDNVVHLHAPANPTSLYCGSVHLGRVFRDARKSCGYSSAAKLAKALGTTERTIRRWEASERGPNQTELWEHARDVWRLMQTVMAA